MAIRESELMTVSVVDTSDFVRAVTAGGGSRKATVSDLAKTIVEDYSSSEIGGAYRSIKEAIDNPIDSSVLAIYTALGWSEY